MVFRGSSGWCSEAALGGVQRQLWVMFRVKPGTSESNLLTAKTQSVNTNHHRGDVIILHYHCDVIIIHYCNVEKQTPFKPCVMSLSLISVQLMKAPGLPANQSSSLCPSQKSFRFTQVSILSESERCVYVCVCMCVCVYVCAC